MIFKKDLINAIEELQLDSAELRERVCDLEQKLLNVPKPPKKPRGRPRKTK